MTATDTVAHLDRPAPQLCANLPMLENALLWTMRAWVIGHARRIDVSARIGAVFDRLGAPLAAPHLDRFMRLLSRSATRVLEVHCVCQTHVSDDEAALLHLFALQQHEAYDDSFALLAAMTHEGAAVIGCDNACRLALALQDAGQTLHRKAAAQDRCDPRWSAVPGDADSVTMH